MEKIDIIKEYNDSFKLNRIIKNISEWSLEPISGKGLYRGHDRFAHIEIKMYKASDESFNSSVIWTVTEKQIPYDPDIKKAVEKSLTFFVELLSVIKGKKINLIIEITGGSFHLVDTRARFYSNAIFLAIINCFEKEQKNTSIQTN